MRIRLNQTDGRGATLVGAITLAQAIRVADRVDGFEVGEHAGQRSPIRTVFIEGRKIHDRQSPALRRGVHQL